MQFYAVKKDDSIKHLKVTAEIQSRLTAKFEFDAAILKKGKEIIPFDSSWKADSDELLQVQDYSLPQSIQDIVSSADRSSDMTREELDEGSIKAIFGVTIDSQGNAREIIFKKIDKSMVINRSRIGLIFDRETLTTPSEPTLIVPDSVAIIYEEGNLLFVSRQTASKILDLTNLFDEASEDQMNSFFSNETLIFSNLSDAKSLADSWCKRRISMILKEEVWNQVSVADIRDWAAECDVNFSVITDHQGNQRIEVPDNRAGFKDFIRILNEDFFEAPFSKRKFLTNSKRPAESPPD